MEQVSLRAWRYEDADRVVQMMNDAAVMQYLTASMPKPYTPRDLWEFIELGKQERRMDRAVLVNGVVAGGIGLSATCMFGYWFGREYHGRGIATQAVRLFLKEVPQNMPECLRLKARVFEPNAASMRVLEKNGFVRIPEQNDPVAAWDGKLYHYACFERAVQDVL